MKPLPLLFVLRREQQMRARWLGPRVRLLLAVAALLSTASFDWTGHFGGASVDATVTTGLNQDVAAAAAGEL
jgi:hypothetical protein